jgi:hypothetical protein
MSQTNQILNYMRRGNSINPMVALRMFGSFRLAARIREIKEYGIKVNRVITRTREGKKFARYSLA